MSNHNKDHWKAVKDNEIFKYIFINRDNRIAFPDTKIGGDLEVTGSLNLPFIDNTIIGSTTPSTANFTTATISTAQVTTSIISGNEDIAGNLTVEGEMKTNKTNSRSQVSIPLQQAQVQHLRWLLQLQEYPQQQQHQRLLELYQQQVLA